MDLAIPGRGARVVLRKPVRGVKLQDQPGSSLRNPTGIVIEIPTDAIVEMEGLPAPSGLCNVLWNGEAISIFYEDLRENGQTISSDGEV